MQRMNLAGLGRYKHVVPKNLTACLAGLAIIVLLGAPALAGDYVPVLETAAGTGTAGYSGDGGPALNARLNCPNRIAVDKAGDIFFIDYNNRVVRKVDVSTDPASLTTVAGGGGMLTTGPAPAKSIILVNPDSLALDSSGNLYVSDNMMCLVWKVNPATGIATRYAGNGAQYGMIDGVPAIYSGINRPKGLASDPAGNLYIADSGNNRIRKVDAITGIIKTVAGNGSYSLSFGSNVPAIQTAVPFPSDVAVDMAGALYIVDGSGLGIRKVDTASGMISTFLPLPMGPGGLYIGQNGEAYITANNSVYKLSSGVSTVVYGTGAPGFSVDGVPVTCATFSFGYQSKACVDSLGNLYIPDSGNNRIRKIALNPPLSAPTGLTATAVNDTEMLLTWASGGGPVAGYKVFTSDGKLVGTTADNSFTVDGLAGCTEYCFYVTAFDKASKMSGASNKACDKTPKVLGTSAMAGKTGGNYQLGSAIPVWFTITNNGVPVGPADIGKPVPRLYYNSGGAWTEVAPTVIGSTDGLFKYVGGGAWQVNLKSSNDGSMMPGQYRLVAEPNTAGNRLCDKVQFMPVPACTFTLLDNK